MTLNIKTGKPKSGMSLPCQASHLTSIKCIPLAGDQTEGKKSPKEAKIGDCCTAVLAEHQQ